MKFTVPIADTLFALEPEARLEALLADLRARAAHAMRMPVEGLTPDRPLVGLDSLAAIELGSAIEDDLGVALPFALLLATPTLRQLAAEVLAGLAAPAGQAEEKPEPEPLRAAASPPAEFPLSYGQRALWYLDRLAPEAGAYVVAAAARVAGGLDPAALGRALQGLADRHPILRTTFAAVDGEPRQRVHPTLPIDFAVVDAAGWSEERLAARLNEEAFRSFDLERGPLVRARVFAREAGGEPVVLLAVHHLVTDFWSLAHAVRELGGLYRAAVAGEIPTTPPAPALVYSDYVDWERRRLAGPAGERLWSYWRERLAGELPDLALTTDRPRPPVQTHRGGSASLRLAAGAADRLRQLAHPGGPGATLFSLLLAAFQALLHRHTGQADLAVGAPVAGRTRAALADLQGYLVNAVALRADFGGDPTFAEHLARTARSVAAALEHQDFPFALLAERLRPLRDPSRSPLFQAFFTLQRSPLPGGEALAALALGDPGPAGRPADLAGLALTALPLERRPAQFDLALETADLDGALAAVLRYNADLFDAATAERLVGRFARLLTAAVERPETPIAELSLLSDAERRELLVDWNATARPLPPGVCLHHLFEEQARRTPAAPAVEMAGVPGLTYGELDLRAGRLARRLRRLGVGPEVPVGLHLERSPGMVVALLGVLKAGGAYLPLDPSYPEERLAYMLEDSGVGVVLTDRPSALPARFRGTAFSLDAPEAGGEEGDLAPVAVDPASLAYLIYTSGSTGRPKGVLLAHRGVVNFLAAMRRAPGLGPEDVLLSVTTLSFDIAALEIFLPLAVGARLVLASRATAADGAALAAEIARVGATALQATPATWRLLLEAGWQGRAELALLCGGEALPRALADALLSRGSALWNLYGPTETTIWSAAGRVEPEAGPVLLGPPIDNTSIHLLDGRLQPVPVGVAGEVHIGGTGLARGYFRRPELTAERFVPDPLGEPGARLYQTGDLARRHADGRIEFLGRTDHQVKVRGHRIELGEIEACLAAHPAVREAVVLAREDRPGDPRLVAYLVAGPAAAVPDASVLRAWLRERLPEPMVPAAFVPLPAWPLTPNGKIDRRALPAPVGVGVGPQAPRALRSGLERSIAAVWREVLGVERVGADDNFFDLGGHSLLLARVHARLLAELPEAAGVTMVDLLRHPTVGALAAKFGGRGGEHPGTVPAVRRRRALPGDGEAIAIIGMSGRFPGAADVERFWQNLKDGVESIVPLTAAELSAAGVASDLLADPAYVRAAAALDGVDLWDAPFFGFTPREAEILDPQHRLFLECAWEALEAAGYDPGRAPGAVGVYAGVGLNSYLVHNLSTNREALEAVGSYQAFISNDKDFVPTRVSYKLGLKGPSVNVQTACSSSLVAVHLARQALLAGECDMALAGGVSIAVPHRVGYLHQEGGILSPDGHCRAFDARARGTVRGSGVGIVVLKRLSEALADGDRVRAVIRGSAINNDGAGKVGYTAPSVDGQAEVIAAALADAGVEAASVGYVEAHGTGTELGDPVEVAALTQAFRAAGGVGGVDNGFCALGSVKTNVGHLDTAAGVAGLIKAALVLESGEIPPSLHYERSNPAIDFAASPFAVNDRLRAWPRVEGEPRRAGVSSFGIGGTNVHVVLEEPPAAPPSSSAPESQLLVLSARSAAALDALTANLATYLGVHPDLEVADLAWTLQVGRKPFAHRRAVVARGAEDAVAALGDPERVRTAVTEAGERPVAFLFPGQGAQHVEMGAGLYREAGRFRELVDEGAERLAPELGLDLRRLLFPPKEEAETAAERLGRTALTQPALFVVEYALARLWMEWGVTPQAMLGHSIGEWVAACLAGVVSYEDALRLVAARGRLMEEQPGGAMVGVELPEREIVPLLRDDLVLGAVNGPAACTVAGPEGAIEELVERLAERGIEGRRLHVSHAFHSQAMDPAVAPFVERVKSVRLHPPRLPFLSNVTGAWITAEEATDPAYWGRQLRSTVRFGDGLAALLAEPGRVLLEVGPGQTLTALARRLPERPAAVPSLRHSRTSQPDREALLDAVGRLWLAGVPIAWEKLHAGEKRRRLTLPTYPFERRRHWVEPGRPEAPATARRPSGMDGWFYAPFWRQTAPPLQAGALDPGPWLVFGAIGSRLAERLRREGREVTEVARGRRGEGLQRTASGFTLEPGDRAAHAALLAALPAPPRRIVHAWAAETPETPASDPLEAAEQAEELAFRSPLFLAQALGGVTSGAPVRLDLVSSGLHRLAGDRAARPEQALLVGPAKVIPQEYPHLRCCAIDLPADGDPEEDLDALLTELAADSPDAAVAWRGGERWVQAFEPVRLPPPAGPNPRLRERGVYLLTGGFGGLGLTFARHLAETVRARLVLVGRTPPPSGDPRLAEITALGGEVLALAADVTDPASIGAAVARARERFGALHGVVHAAGLPGGGVIHLKTAEAAARVLAPKVRGTLALEQALAGETLDFFLLCSSVNALLGGFGQVDYCAANAFLDAFARSRSRGRGTFYAAVDWDRWRSVGMAASPGDTATGAPLHPLLDRCLAATPERAVYASRLAVEERWVLSEHRVLGRATVPGTTYLEMARAAHELSAGGPVEIRETVFLTPLVVTDGERADVLTVLEKEADGFRFRVVSQPADGDGAWREHCRGWVGRPDTLAALPSPTALAAVRARCPEDLAGVAQTRARGLAGFLDTGPRWQSLKAMSAGPEETLAELELDAAFASEIAESFVLHPALLDVATGSIRLRVEGNYLPFAYERLSVRAPLPARFWSHARFRAGAADADTLTCDLSLLDADGVERVAIAGFSMKRVGEEAAAQLRSLAQSGNGAARSAPGDPRVAALFAGLYGTDGEAGIAPSEGVQAFDRILANASNASNTGLPQVVVSTRDLDAALAQARSFDGDRIAAALAALGTPAAPVARPEVETVYLAPGSALEQRIAAVWQKVLGIEQIGVHDNFFELGGTSLTGVQLIAELKKALGVDVPSVSIFEAPTVAALARLLAPKESGPAFGHAQERARKKQEVLERQRAALGAAAARRRAAP